jgi:hypothetical protein
MSPETFCLIVSAVAACWLAVIAQFFEGRSSHWLSQANRLEAERDEYKADCDYYRSLLGWLKSKEPTLDVPDDLLIGTASNPILTPTGNYSPRLSRRPTP